MVSTCFRLIISHIFCSKSMHNVFYFHAHRHASMMKIAGRLRKKYLMALLLTTITFATFTCLVTIIRLTSTTSVVYSRLKTTSNTSRCDEECERFRKVFAVNRWSADKPLAAVYYLVTGDRLADLNVSLRLLDDNFVRQFRYPVVLFYEDSDARFDVERVRSFVASSDLLFFQKVTFELPSFVDRSKVPKYGCLPGRFPIGYRHMCRFQARTVYDEPIMDGLEYALRLDDDSHISRPITYDVFHFMRTEQIQYGYVYVTYEYNCFEGLWEAADVYVSDSNLTPTFYANWTRRDVFYNNFEISALNLWRSASYQKYIDYIDRLGGIYYHRWGDAPIKTIAVSLFVPYEHIHRFNVTYQHQHVHENQ